MENSELLEIVRKKAQVWLGPEYDEETRREVQALLDKDDPTDLIEAFYKDLEFGTGGLRGIMGVGTNRMNIYTVGAATNCRRLRLSSAMTVGTTAVDSLRFRPIYSQPTASRFTSSTPSVRHPRPRMPFAILVARAASSSQPRTIPRNTTATRPTGTTAHR